MEQYKIHKTNATEIVLGKYYKEIHNSHILSYGIDGAKNIVDNVLSTYKCLISQIANTDNHNSLLVGKVQSGKTSNLELLSAIAFDNGYNFLIIYGGYDKELLRQTTERYGCTFNTSNKDVLISEGPALFTTGKETNESNKLSSLNVDSARTFIKDKRPIIVSCLKRPAAMKKVNKLVRNFVAAGLNIVPFIIDDEGDQASLNTAKDKANDETPTYNQIVKMKDNLSNPLYLSVTATPQANIFQSNYSKLTPSTIHLIQPGSGYNGASFYHLSENDIIYTIDKEIDSGVDMQKDSIFYFLIASTIKKIRAQKSKDKFSDMIIHEFREKVNHSDIFVHVDDELRLMKSSFENKDDSMMIYLNWLENCYNKYFSQEIREKYKFDLIKAHIGDVILGSNAILQNSDGKLTQERINTTWHRIYIGGDLLQRGLTFSNLITTYFTRWASTGGNMDTNLQRARWFGYREKYIDLCKIFTTEEVAQEFSNLADIEDDLWEQFADVEDGRLGINDIIISSDGTKQKPTAKNKASYKKVSFKNRWIKQRFIVTEKEQINTNNQKIAEIIQNSKWIDTTAGSKVNEVTGRYTYLSPNVLKDLISSIESAFDKEPFQKKALLDIIGETNIPVIIMGKQGTEARYRSVYGKTNPERIKALLQGANSTIKEKVTYEGDSKVIIDSSKVNIQIHYVSAGYTKKDLLNKDQYMFAIYIPKDKLYFVKDYEL